MKTKNDVQKATTKLLVLGLILVGMSICVYAQNVGEVLPEAGGYKGIILAMADNTIQSYSSSTEADVYASYFVVDTEDALELDDWMSDKNIFDVYSQYFQPEQEEALEVEDWMIDESTFNHLSFQFNIDSEDKLELEEWMTSGEVWNR